MRGRGLKRCEYTEYENMEESPLMRGRGLKRTYEEAWGKANKVAPHAGAWIETQKRNWYNRWSLVVAPHAGAWIETYRPNLYADFDIVAPHAGAWIETRMRSLPK